MGAIKRGKQINIDIADIKELHKSELSYVELEQLRIINWERYEKLTGRCATCRVLLEKHPKCDACGTMCGTGHLVGSLSPYRNHNLCGYCIGSWNKLEVEVGRSVLWQNFLNPRPHLFEKPSGSGNK